MNASGFEEMERQFIATHVRKLHFEKGDVLVIGPGVDPRQVEQLQIPGLDFLLPILYAPPGGVSKTSIEEMRRIVEMYDRWQSELNPEP